MRLDRLLYRLVLGSVRTLGALAGRGDSKVARGVRGRRGAEDRLTRWGREARDPGRPTVWLHAPSVGEGLQARAVLEALRARRTGVQAVFTHFSPSAEGLAASMPVDVAGYLPWDLVGPMAAALDALEPDLLAFTKTEVWPVLVEEAVRRDVPVALAAGTLPRGAGRLSTPARVFLRSTWRRLAFVGAIAEEDAQRFRDLGVPEKAVVVTGDPGIDSAARRAEEADPEAPYLEPFRESPAPTLIAGSTWPADEEMLLPALASLRRRVPGMRAVLAPHEPTPEHVSELLLELDRAGWLATTLGEVEQEGTLAGAAAVVVDRVGVLAHLYTVGSAAYVGGGFHGHGLHSVLEPAAARMPVVFGPRHHNARAAWELVEAGGARVAEDADSLTRILDEWLTDEETRDYAAGRAFGYIDGHRGAARATAAHLERLLHPSTS